VILTLDLGTTRTKAVLWGENGVVASGDAVLRTDYPAPGRAEQDAAQWWPSVVAACAAAREAAPGGFGNVEAIGFAAARQTFVPVTASGEPIGAALLWSDRRVAASPADPGGVAAKVAWLHAHEPSRLHAARWLLAPRDLVVWQLTGTVATDTTLVSASGLPPDCELVPPASEPTTVVGPVRPGPADALGVPPGTPVVLGAGDRACEVLGTGATSSQPMVSWGTAANMSVPVACVPTREPTGLVVSRGALGGWLLEGGLVAGPLLEWLSGITGTSVDALAGAAGGSPPGARGVTALGWLGGARAPWWRDGTGAAFFGLGPAHTAADLARACVEAVAFDIVRCIEASASVPDAMVLAGGAGLAPWPEIVTAVAGVPGIVRRWRDAASAGALVVTARALGRTLDLEEFNPVTSVVEPAPELVAAYRALRAVSDGAVAAGLSLAPPQAGGPA
jgi:sugar (pentulose or hexulose) kinase